MANPGPVALIVRYDDFFSPEANPRAAPELRRIEGGLARIHHRADLPAVFAVVPTGVGDSGADRAVLEDLRRACAFGSEIALHGYNHEDTLTPPRSAVSRAWARFCRRTHSEFAGLPLPEQVRRMAEGRARLRALFPGHIRTFIPPWNAYDHNTVKACRRAGIHALSASRAWPVPHGAATRMIPQTVGADGLEGAVEFSLRRRRPAAVVCVVHVWDFAVEPRAGCILLDSWAARLRALGADPRIKVTTIDRLDGPVGALLTPTRLRRNQFVTALLRIAAACGAGRSRTLRRGLYPLD